MLKALRDFFQIRPATITEGLWADQYQEDHEQKMIRDRYRHRWPDPSFDPTPESHPWLFDPCSPPQGWRYDPCYEMWIRL